MKKVQIDEIELYLELLRSEIGDKKLSSYSYSEIAEIIQNTYQIECSERDIFLLYEPTLDDSILDLELQYKIFGEKWNLQEEN